MQQSTRGFGQFLQAFRHPSDIWVAALIWVIIAGACILVANVLAAGI